MKPLLNLLGFALLSLLFVVVTFGVGLVFIPVYWALVLRGAADREQTAFAKLQATLMAHEAISHKALQLRVCALRCRRVLVAVTGSRVIVVTRPLLGGFQMQDYQWKDLRDVQLSENVLPDYFGSSITFLVRREGQQADDAISIDGIDSAIASRLYAEAQSQEQAWEEKRRVRELEEKRAASGGVNLSGGLGGASAGSGGSSSLEELAKAKRLFDSGAISDAEYQEIKAKILSRQAF